MYFKFSFPEYLLDSSYTRAPCVLVTFKSLLLIMPVLFGKLFLLPNEVLITIHVVRAATDMLMLDLDHIIA